VVADRREEDLRLVLEAAERLAVHDAIAVDRERRPCRRGLLGHVPARGRRARGVRGEILLLEFLGVLADAQCGGRARARELRLGARLRGHDRA
jgi:hypothetical protein